MKKKPFSKPSSPSNPSLPEELIQIVSLSFLDQEFGDLILHRLEKMLKVYFQQVPLSRRKTASAMDVAQPILIQSSIAELLIDDHTFRGSEILLVFVPPSITAFPAAKQVAIMQLFAKFNKVTIVRCFRGRDGTQPKLRINHHKCSYFNLDCEDGRSYRRLIRRIAGGSIGLILSGGGARGFIQLGVIRALLELHIPLDYFGGSSVGAVVAACMAMGVPFEEVVRLCSIMGDISPTTKEFNLFPIYSLKKGRKLGRILEEIFGDLRIENLWYPFFCVVSNISKSQIDILRDGYIYKALQATTAIPLIFPPYIIDEQLMVDGALMDNLPVNFLPEHVSRKIAIDVSVYRKAKPVLEADFPSSRSYILNKIGINKKRYGLPLLPGLFMQTMFANSICKAKQSSRNTDLYFNPPPGRFGFHDWHKRERMVEFGYNYASEILAQNNWTDLFPETKIANNLP